MVIPNASPLLESRASASCAKVEATGRLVPFAHSCGAEGRACARLLGHGAREKKVVEQLLSLFSPRRI